MTETRLWGRGREGGGGAGRGRRREGPESGGEQRPGRREPRQGRPPRPGLGIGVAGCRSRPLSARATLGTGSRPPLGDCPPLAQTRAP